MKKGLLATTALAGAGAGALVGGAALAAEAPTWKLSGNMNFNFYYVDEDAAGVANVERVIGGPDGTWVAVSGDEDGSNLALFDVGPDNPQDHGWYFGVDEAELTLKVDGAADNGLKYGFKVEIQVNTTDGTVADEARIQLAGNWGTLQLGDEDGAEDIMNYGGENLLGGGGGFDGDLNDVLNRKAGQGIDSVNTEGGNGPNFYLLGGDRLNFAAPRAPNIAGDSGDGTKISYFSPRFSGFQVGASITPTPNTGDQFKTDGSWENHIGLGANYDNTFGSLHLQGSFVYSTRSNVEKVAGGYTAGPVDAYNDVSAWSVGGIVGWGPFSVGANYTDNSDSAQPTVGDEEVEADVTAPVETSYWDVAARFTTGPMKFGVGYFVGTKEFTGFLDDSTFEHIALTADYTAAPGLGFYAEIDLTSEELFGGGAMFGDAVIDGNEESLADHQVSLSNDATILIIGAKVSF